MMAGTPHVALTLRRAVCEGFFFFPSEGFEATLDAMVAEHFGALYLNNSSEPNLTTHFFRL